MEENKKEITYDEIPQKNGENQKNKNIEDFGEINNIISKDILKLFCTNKWEDKKEGINKIYNLLNNNNKSSEENIDSYYIVYNFIKLEIKNFKETNINLLKESLNIFCYLIPIISKNKDNFILIFKELINGFYVKLSENKINELIENMFIILNNINEKEFNNLILEKLKTEKKGNILKSYSIFYENLIKKKGNINNINRNDIISYCINMSNNRDPQIRTSSINLLSILYSYIGYDLRKILSEKIKGATYKLIEESFNKIDNENLENYLVNDNSNDENLNTTSQNNNNTEIKDEIKQKKNNKNEEIDYNIIIKNINSGKWVDKKENLEILINEVTNNYQNIKNPSEIIKLIKEKLNDKQQKLVIMITSLLNLIVNKLKDYFNKEFLSIIAVPLINNLNDNNDEIRKSTKNVISNIILYKDCELLINHLILNLKQEKFHLRFEILSFFIEYINNLTKKHYNLLVEPILLCLQDKSNEIKNLSENIIKESKKFININEYYKSIKSLFKKVIGENIKEIVEKCFGIIKNNNNDFSSTILPKTSFNSTLSENISNNKLNKTMENKSSDKIMKARTTNYNKSRDKSRDKSRNKSKDSERFIYKNFINFQQMKKIRNNKDIKLSVDINYIINMNLKDDFYFFTLFFNEDYINNTLLPKKKNIKEILEVLKKLCHKDSFKEFFYPNYDLMLKYIIKSLSSINNYTNDIFDSIIDFLSCIYEEIKLNDSSIDNIESTLTLELLIYLKEKFNDEKKKINSLLVKYYEIIKMEKAYLILFNYTLNNNNLNEKDIILDLFYEELTKGKIIINKHIKNFKLLINFFFINQPLTKKKVQLIFNFIANTYGDNIFNDICNQLSKQEKEILFSNMNISFNHIDSNINSSNYTYSQNSTLSNSTQNSSSLIVLHSPNDIIDILNGISSINQINDKEGYLDLIKDLFSLKMNFINNKKLILSFIDLISQTLISELEKYLNINTIYTNIPDEEVKYINNLIGVFNHIFLNKEIIEVIKIEIIKNLCITFFNYLQIDNEKKVLQIYHQILKKINTIMINLIRNSKKDIIIYILLEISNEYRLYSDITNLSINCLLYLMKENLINYSELNSKNILIKMTKIANEIDEKNLDKNDKRSLFLIKYIKKLLKEIVYINKERIMNDYQNFIDNNIQDNYIYIWIDKILEKINK